MSDNIPFDIQTEIIKRVLVVKSLIRLSSVSKQWKSLIESSEFITHHVKQAHPHHVLYEPSKEKKYVSVVDDDDSFRQHKFSLIDPPTLNNVSIIDCSHGLVCLHVLIRYEDTCLITVWNPSIRKSVSILLPSTPLIVSFGVCPQTSDPKIVKINIKHSKPTVEVLTLSTRAWSRVPMTFSRTSLGSSFSRKQVVIDGVIYRVVCDLNPGSHHVIMSFDLTKEEFGEVALPERLGGLTFVKIFKLKESLAVIDDHSDCALHLGYDIWIMSKNGVSVSSFTKLFLVKVDTSCSYRILGFRMNGQVIMTKCANGRSEQELVVYDPNTKIMNGLGIYGFIFYMVNYTESLLLINYSDSIIIIE